MMIIIVLDSFHRIAQHRSFPLPVRIPLRSSLLPNRVYSFSLTVPGIPPPVQGVVHWDAFILPRLSRDPVAWSSATGWSQFATGYYHKWIYSIHVYAIYGWLRTMVINNLLTRIILVGSDCKNNTGFKTKHNTGHVDRSNKNVSIAVFRSCVPLLHDHGHLYVR